MLNLGRTVLVASVKEVAKEAITNIPSRYVRDDDNDKQQQQQQQQQQQPPIVAHLMSSSVPVIDIHNLVHLQTLASDHELLKLDSACKDWGFFQDACYVMGLLGDDKEYIDGIIEAAFWGSGFYLRNLFATLLLAGCVSKVINHGVSTSLLETFKAEVSDFFNLPIEEKKNLWQNSDNQEGFGQLFVLSEQQKLDWSDMFYIHTLPPKLRRTELFDKLPRPIREAMEAYIAATEKLALTLLHQMAKALGINKTEMDELFHEGFQSIRMNYYPPCPEPHKAIGLAPHSDADALTIVFQLNSTQGLEIRKDGNWVPVMPLENAFVVNIGDVMEIVSNGIYCSVEHRATVNSTKERLSVATFYSANLNSEIGPSRSIVGPQNPPVFRRELYELYYKGFFARKLNGKSYIEDMRLEV